MRPYDAKSTDDVCDGLRSDNFSSGDVWIVVDGYRVTIAEQRVGDPPTQRVSLSRDAFNALIDWYMCQQKSREVA